MSALTFEVINRFHEAIDANKLLYTPLPDSLTYRQTRVYTAECEGDLEAAREYMLRVVADPIAQQVDESGSPALEGELFRIEYGMKPGSLDLEKEAILENYRGRKNLPFELKSLKITQRVYIFGEGEREALAARFTRDVCNPAIHHWTVA